ncbi:LYR motif-containing protein 4B [Abrus precatorius]|uniref:LYR motif-containing protein 4B n=1 Tax=Abrus precatorius TaxID=3816 RepID=A0A8B8L9D6_ABRPR|nr:LYR motif-containing protein 4B [Abrus precatorius]
MSGVSTSVPSTTQILSLFRSLLRVARHFPDYNIREYTKRRTIDAFRQNATLSDPSAISSAFSHAKSQLEVAKRQAVVYSLYAPPLRSVMELQQPFH